MQNTLETASDFSPRTGAWATARILQAMSMGQPINSSVLRTCDALRKDEWVVYDEAIVEEGAKRLFGVADLLAAGLTFNVSNALGKTVYQYETVTEMQPAIVNLDGIARGDLDSVEFAQKFGVLPIISKDFDINLRRLEASRETGESLDTMKARMAGKLCAEQLELMLFQGGPTFGDIPIYGYTTHPNRVTAGFISGAWSATARTGAEVLADALGGIKALRTRRFNGPFWIYNDPNSSTKLDEDYSDSKGNNTIRQRLLAIEGVEAVRTVDSLPDDNIVIVNATSDVVILIDGEGLQTVQWDLYGGFRVAMKAFLMQAPLIRSTASGRCGVVHIS